MQRPSGNEEISIIGVGLRLPGAEDLDTFWSHLAAGRSLITEVPARRWNSKALQSDPANGDRTSSIWGGFVEDADCFDASFFNISPREAAWMDPQQRFALELAWQAIEDAGYPARSLAGTRTGVYMGVCHWDYAELLEKHLAHVDAYTPTGIAFSIIANRISHFFDLRGPSIANDTACAASLTSVYEAVRALQCGECEQALAGGVNLIWSPNHFIAFSRNGMLSRDGASKAFDQRADGYVRGEGGAMLLLKPLPHALRDGDPIHAVIRGIGVNHGGRTNSLTVTSPQAQGELIAKVVRAAGVWPDSISYIEAHGTGTPLGDPIEIAGLKQAFATLYREVDLTPAPGSCGIGSVKTNIGHLEGAAGVAGIVKVLAALRYEALPANVDFRELNSLIEFDGSPFRIQDALQPWPRVPGRPRRAGVSSFGFGGSNGHTLLEEAPAADASAGAVEAVLIPLSARDARGLKGRASLLLEFLQRAGAQASLVDIAWTLQAGRDPMEARVAILAQDLAGLQLALQAFLADEAHTGVLQASEADAPACAGQDPLTEAGKRWLAGEEVEWRNLYQGIQPRRIHMPGYPFARERHWMDLSLGAKDPEPAVHPLLQRNLSRLAEVRYESRLHGSEFFWAEHHVGDRQVLPGVVCLEMARAAWAQATGNETTAVALDKLVWTRAIAAADAAQEPVSVAIRLRPVSGDRLGFEVETVRDGAVIACAQGVVGASEPQAVEPDRLDLAALRASTSTTLDAEAVYERLRASGTRHGASFQAISKLHVGEGFVLAALRLPRRLRASMHSLVLHPLLLDAAIAAWVGQAEYDRVKSGPWVPFACDRIEVMGTCEELMWALLRPIGKQDADAALRRFDIALCDREGSIRVRFHGLALKASTTAADSDETIFSTPQWTARPLVSEGDLPRQTRVLLGGYSEAFARGLAQHAGLPMHLLPCAGTGGDVHACVQSCLAALQNSVSEAMRERSAMQQQWLVLLAPGLPAILGAPLAALLRTAHAEQPRFLGAVLSIEGEGEPAHLAQILQAECARADSFTEIRYDVNGQRSVLRPQVLGLPGASFRPRDSQGAVWITGGMGGLGRHFVAWLAERGVRRIVLSGRAAEPDAAALRALRERMDPDLNVLYRMCDVSDREQVQACVRWIADDVGPLRGVIHAAGFLRDAYLLNKRAEDLEAVLAPKVAGTLNIDTASAHIPLEFFVLCSSIAGVYGNPAQADYAAANAFMDSWAEQRAARVLRGERHGVSLAVAWPLWADGGMQVDAATQTAMQRRFGTVALPTAAALAALERMLAAGGPARITVQHGAPERIHALIDAFGEPAPEAVPGPVATQRTATLGTSATVASAAFRTEALEVRTIAWLKELLGELIQMDTARIRGNRKLEEYGLDSIMIVEITNRMEEVLGPLSKTLFFEYVDLDSLGAYIAGEHGAALSALFSEEEVTAPEVTQDVSEPEVPPVQARAAPSEDPGRPERDSRDIAIVGMSLCVSGASDQQSFWRMLEQGLHGFERFPSDRWDHDALLHPERDVPGKTVVQTGAFLDGIDQFDPRYFRISQAEAELMSPEVRLFLQSCVEAFEDAGYSRETMQRRYGGDVAVIVGSMTNEYDLYGFENMLVRGAQASGSYTGTVPNMVSYYYGFTGPSYFLDTMCSAAATCVHEAVQMLRGDRCAMALAGGVSLLLHPQKLIATSQEHFTSKTAEVIRGYGMGADGTILGEGVGALVMKRLADAERDGDHIYGVIRGTGVSNAGVRNGFTVPNPHQQAAAIEQAWTDSGIDPRTIGYIEGHGSGTSLGDPIEVKALTSAFRRFTDERQFCPIGTVKSNVAHLLGAAALPGIAKVLLQMRHGKLAPSLHAQELNPNIDFAQTPFYVQRELADWPRLRDRDGRELPRRAGVTSIGAGGMNAHIVLEEYREAMRNGTTSANPEQLCVFSAMTPDALRRVLERFCQYLEEEERVPFADLAWTLQVGKNELPCRLAVLAADHDGLLQMLREFLAAPSLASGGVGGRAFYVSSVLDHDVEPGGQERERAVRERQLVQLGQWWVQGLAIDWADLLVPGQPGPKRVSLPAYSFERVRCWVQSYPDAPSVIHPLGARLKLHPFVGSNQSDLRGLRYRTPIHLEELRDYRYARERQPQVLPTAIIEIMAALGRVAGVRGNKGGLTVRQLQVLRPAAWPETASIEASVEPDNDGVRIRLDRQDAEGREVSFARAQAAALRADEQAAWPRLSLQEIRERARERLDGAQLYRRLADARLVFAPYLEVVEETWLLGNRTVLCAVRESHPQQDRFKHNLVVPPRLLAATWQALLLGLESGEHLEVAGLDALQVKEDAGKAAAYVLVRAGRRQGAWDVFFLGVAGDTVGCMLDLQLESPSSWAFVGDASPAAVMPVPAGSSARMEDASVARTAVSVGPDPGLRRVLDGLRELVARMLKFPADQVGDRARFYDLGFDSISLARLAEEINALFDCGMTPAIFFERERLEALAAWITPRAARQPGAAATAPVCPSSLQENRVQPAHTPQAQQAAQAELVPMAVIGLAACLPGADDADTFFRHLLEGQDLIGPLPLERYSPSYRARIEAAGFPLRGGFLRDIDRFDAAFFKTSPHEASRMDPQQRLMLETVWRALEDAGYHADELESDTGVFVGVSGHDYASLLQAHGVETDGYVATGNSLAMVANRVSWHLNLRGPSESVDTACSSSLVALLRAVDAVRSGRCRTAIVGGVNLALALEGFAGPWQAGMLSPEGRCKTFSSTADGYVRGEGVVVLVIKALSDAERDDNRIHGVIRGGAENHGGRAGSLTAPNPNAQADLVHQAMRGIDCASIGYIETHGTGTNLGDPVEINGLKLAYARLAEEQGKEGTPLPAIGLGSVKSNIGHLEATAGLAGVVKVLLALRARALPPTLHCAQVNPYIDLAGSPFHLVQTRQEWPDRRDALGHLIPRRAGVSSFGFGGSNAHVVLEEYPSGLEGRRRTPLSAHPFADTRYWVPGTVAEGVEQAAGQETVMLRPVWEASPLSTTPVSGLVGNRLILPCEFELGTTQGGAQVIAVPALAGGIAVRYQALARILLHTLQQQLQAVGSEPVLIQLLVPLGDERAVHEGLGAMLDSACAESGRLLGQVVGVPATMSSAEALATLEREAGFAHERRIRYLGRQRLVRRWTELTAQLNNRQHPIAWRTNGVYLISGGLGALGWLVAQDIARQAHGARLMLLGASPLNADRIAALEALRAQGADAYYCSCDVSDMSAVHAVVQETLRQHGALHGVIHCAGVHRDSAIVRKSQAELDAVLAPKVVGAVALRDACSGLNLDCFVLFSSLAGAVGNAGQADYAAANGFLGALAEQEAGRLCAIDWPYWREGGMRVDARGELAFFREMGQRPLESNNGLRALHLVVHAGLARAAVIAGEGERIRAFFSEAALLPRRHAMEAARKVAVDADPELGMRVANKLRALLADLAGISPQQILLDEALENYGIDSLMIGKLNRALSEHFDALSRTLFFEYRNLQGVADHLAGRHPQACRRWVGMVPQPPARATVAGLPPFARVVTMPALSARRASGAREPIAIIGISGQYPDAPDLDRFWANLAAGHDAIREVPSERWSLDAFFESDPDRAVASGKSYARWGGFLDGFADFDPMFFRISPRDAAAMDPQERLFLMQAWAACEDAGYTRARFTGRHASRVGVFVGVTKTGYALHAPFLSANGAQVRPGSSFASVANRVSHFLDLHGPSVPVDTMCSSSLTAIHQACEDLYAGDCEVALAGGVNLYLHPSNFVELCASRMLSADGRCRSFGFGGNGFVPGEGAGCLVLKPLSRALEDGDRIHALIRGTAINHGGRTNGYAVPNPAAQRDVVQAALRNAGLAPRDINCLEAHGTGTELGDPIEFNGLVQAFGQSPAAYCSLGSVKSGIGHLEAAAGIAGLTKVMLQMRHRQLVPTLHAARTNPNLDFAGTPFRLQQELTPWQPGQDENGNPRARIAGVSSFGAGGANAHVIIEEWPSPDFVATQNPRTEEVPAQTAVHPVLLSARDGERLRESAARLLAALDSWTSGPVAATGAPLAREALTAHVRELLAQILSVSSDDLDDEESFDSIGIEAVQRQALRHALEQRFDLNLSPAMFHEVSTVVQAASLVAQQLGSGDSQPQADLRKPGPSLADIAWTLQVGREAMDCRLAVAAGSREELAAALRAWLAGETRPGVCSDSASAHHGTLGVLSAEADLSDMLQRWLARGDLDRVLGLWVRGLDIDWAALPGRVRQGRIVSLPTYPFARQHFWIPRAASYTALVNAIEQEQDGRQPLLGQHALLERQLARMVRTLIDVRNRVALPPFWARWHGALERLVAQAAGDDSAHAPVNQQAAWAEWEQMKRALAEQGSPLAQAELAEISLRALPDMLEGRVAPTAVLFPEGRISLVEATYKQNLVARRFNQRLADAAAACVAERRQADPGARVRILEIGAGTGGTSEPIFKALAPHAGSIAEYCYTDVSRAFLIHAQRQFATTAPCLRTALLDVEKPLAGQDVEPHGYDLVIAANVLHATRDVAETMCNVRELLRLGGVLLVNETSCATLFTHLTFGLLDGWWRFSDAGRRLPGSPSLAPRSWRSLLEQTGFAFLAGTPESEHALGQQLLAAAAMGQETVARARASASVEAASHFPAAADPAPGPAFIPASKPGALRKQLLEALAATLNVGPGAIDVNRPFADFGLDSILGAELVHRLRTALGVPLEQTQLFDFTNVTQLEAHLRNTHGDMLARAAALDAPKLKAARIEAPVATSVMAAPVPSSPEPIAIVGFSGRFAGSDNVEQLWQHLMAGRDLVRPAMRFDLAPFAHKAEPGSWCSHGGFIDGIEMFDAQFFNISGLEATYMDPQQRLFLEEAWKTLEHAGHAGADIEGSRCGVFVGCAHGDYQELFRDQPPGQAFWGNTCSLIPARIAYHLNLKGPSIAVDTACSSSLVALHLACQSLWNGESDLALAGGAFVQSSSRFHRYANQARMLSPSGRCAAFGEGADGIVPGEAVAAMLLRPLSQALADGDTVYGLIVASGTNQDGATNGITAPSARSQEQLISDVYRRFGIDPARIGLMEAHGTGTVLGDPIEHAALTRAWRQWTDARNFCALGSIKSNIGHATTAAGAAGVIKALLALGHQRIPPTLHAEKPNPALRMDDSPFFLNNTPVAWPATGTQARMAAVSSFGFGGTNAHVVIEEAPALGDSGQDTAPAWLFPLSARTSQQLRLQAQDLLEHLHQPHGQRAADISFTLCVGRRHLSHRLIAAASDLHELREYLKRWLAEESGTGVKTAVLTDAAPRDGEQEALLPEPGTLADPGQYRAFLLQMGEDWLQGQSLATDNLFPTTRSSGAPVWRRIALPVTCFERKRYWVEDSAQAALQPVAEAMPAAVPTARSMPAASAGARVRAMLPVRLSEPAAMLRFGSPATPAPVALAPLAAAAEHAASLRLSDEEGVRHLHVRSPWNEALMRALARELESAGSDDAVRVALLTAEEGLQVKAANLDPAAIEWGAALTCALPVVAALPHASGLASLLLVQSDFLVLAEQGRYTCDLELGTRDCALLERRFGPELAHRLRADGVFGDACQAGIAVVAAPRQAAEGRALAMAIAAAPRLALVELKRHLRQGPQVPANPPAVPATVLPEPQADTLRPAARRLPLETEAVTLELFADGVTLMRMQEREHKNSFTPAFMEAMQEAFEVVARTPACKVVVLTGYDSYFACGGTRDGLESLQRGATRFTDKKIYSLPLDCELPVIAAMQGHAIGAGWSLGMFCDTSILAADSVYHSNYLWYGFTPGAGATLVFPHRMGDDLGREVLFTAREYNGRELAGRGCPLPVVPASEVLPRALALAHAMARAPREQLLRDKDGQTQTLRANLEQVFEREYAMHEKTFIGNQRVMERIASMFPEAPASRPVADARSAAPASDALDRRQIRAQFMHSLAEELMIAPDDIGEGSCFLALGLDSILAVTWIRKLNAMLGIDLPATCVYAHPTVGTLFEHVLRLAPHRVVAAEAPAEEPLPACPAPDIVPSPALVAAIGDSQAVVVRKTVLATLAEELMIAPDEITDAASFLGMGLDSILAVTWIRKLNSRLDIALPATSVYAHPTVRTLVEQVTRLVAAKGTTKLAPAMPDVVSAAVAELVPQVAESAPAALAAPKNEAASAQPPAIAIIGASGRFPEAADLEAFWENLRSGRDCIREVPPSRWEIERYWDPDPQAPGKSYSKWMGAIDDIDLFDTAFFNTTAREAELMDPQQRLFLQHAWHAIEDAAVDPLRLSATRCGVFVGSGASGYAALSSERNAYSLIGSAGSILAARIAYLLDLRGPCIALDTACSTSLVAIAEACDSLALGNTDLALAGGACVLLGPDMHINTSKVNMLSPQGRCYSFDDRANGFVPGEGVGVMLLKRLEDAQRDGDPIRAVIRGWGVNQDGKTNGITAPNPQAQGALLRDVYKRFGIAPDSIGLVEAHGTGTPLGDPIEIEGLCGGFGVDGDSRFEVALGSVKSNVGHLLAAAGVAGALKAMLALEHRELPPLVNFERENPHLNLERTPFRIHTSVQPWRAAEGARRRAAVSAFGFSGTNAHVVLEEYDDVALREKAAPSPEACMGVLSARSEAQLNEWAGQLLRFLGGRGAALRSAEDMRDLAWTLQVGRSAFECRAAFVFQDRGSLLRALSAVAAGTLTEGVWCGRRDTAAIALFEDDADGRALLQRWVAGARLEKLAEQWTRGVTIDWRALPRAHHGRRLRLPGYPFARDRHWVKPSPQQSAPLAAKSATQLAPRLHPLIDRNASTLERARFAGRFSGEEAFLSHYLAGAERVLLGLFYPEMARAAGELASTREICGLRHMVWGKPARINGEPRDLVVTLAQDRDGLLYRVCPEGNEDAPCHVGELLLNPADAAWPVLPDLRAIPAGQDCSAAFGARMHGSPSTLVREVIQADGRLWARFCRPTAAESLMLIDPLVLDAAWQLVAYHGQTQGLAGPRFPYALALLLQKGALPDEGWIVLWRPDRNDQTLTLVVLDGAGEPALLLEGLLTEQMEALTVLHINDETLA